jgi:hypothetical protein
VDAGIACLAGCEGTDFITIYVNLCEAGMKTSRSDLGRRECVYGAVTQKRIT